MFSFDPLYILLAIPALLIGTIAQILVRFFYSKYLRVPNSRDITGVEVAEMIARDYGINIRLNVALTDLSDHYHPATRELTLSEKVARLPTVSSVGIAAHEMGHAYQHMKSSILFSIRNFMAPIVSIGSTIGYILFIIGLSFNFLGIAFVGIIFFSLSTLFTILTLPIEIDASIKALNMIRRLRILEGSEIQGVKKVLFAAALTYIAAVMQSLSSLFYYIIRALGFGRRDNS